MTSLRYCFTIIASTAVGVAAFLAAVVLMMGISRTVRSASMTDIPHVGTPAPEFVLQNLAGGTARLSDLRGKPALLVFWADWCHDCNRIVPELNRMHLEGIPVVGINLMEDRERVAKAVERQPIRYPVLLDESGEVGRAYGVEALPNVFVIDAHGKVVHHGFATPARIPEVQDLFRAITP